MKEKQTLTGITTRALEGLEKVIMEVQPEVVLVHGDTTTTFAGALAAFYQKVAVGHVEAGLRTYDKYQPFPEEMNRKLTTAMTDFHFAPTETAKDQLLREGVDESKIFVTGNTVIDALSSTITENYTFALEELNRIDFENRRVITMTAHRRENLGEPLEEICQSVYDIAMMYPEVEIVYAVHLNPLVQEVAQRILGSIDRVHLVPPLELKDMHNLLAKSYLVLTDSGGLQEEVPSLGKPVLVLRNVTERPEGVAAGTLKLVGTDRKVIVENVKLLMDDSVAYEKMANSTNPYGDGKASIRIANILSKSSK